MKPIRNNTVIIILGPTGVGKTAVSIQIAKALDTEIISADSMLVYKHMNIGTAKPSSEELREVPHHLIDIAEPDELFSAGLFKEKATAIIEDIHGKGKIPLVVGGTGLYISTLTRGLFDGPSADEELRKKLMEEERQHGDGHLYRKLQRIDHNAAEKIELNDMRKIIRALEISHIGGQGVLKSKSETTAPSDYDFIKLGLSRDRKELYDMINKRVDQMMDAGLLKETKQLLELRPNRTALQALGYKEIRMYLDGAVDLQEAMRLTKKRSRMYAKRQYTWFRKEPEINWVDITGIMDAEGIYSKVLNEVEILKKIIYS